MAPDSAPLAGTARSGEPDRYLAALLAHPEKREGLLALAEFSVELAAIPQRVVHEPAMGEIRLQWWHDALTLPPELRAGHPVADAVRKAAQVYGLSTPLLEALVDARLLLFHNAAPLSDETLGAFLWKSEGVLFMLGAEVVGLPRTVDVEALCAAAGEAYGQVRILLALPRMLAHGRAPLAKSQLDAAGLTLDDLLGGPGESRIEGLAGSISAQIRRNLEVARQHLAGLTRFHRTVFLPLALVEPYLRALERAGPALLRQDIQIAPLTRVWAIGAAHLLGRL